MKHARTDQRFTTKAAQCAAHPHKLLRRPNGCRHALNAPFGADWVVVFHNYEPLITDFHADGMNLAVVSVSLASHQTHQKTGPLRTFSVHHRHIIIIIIILTVISAALRSH